MFRGASNVPVSGGGIGLKSSGILAQSAVPASVTGTTSETVLATIPVPAGAMGPNGALLAHMQWSVTNNANAKTAQVRFGGTSFVAHGLSSIVSMHGQTVIRNRGVTNSQCGTGSMAVATTGAATTTGTIDTTVAQNITITATLAVGTDTVTLEGYTVELLNP